jgi:hypothetical protein
MYVIDDKLKLYTFNKKTKLGDWILITNFKIEVLHHSINQLAGRSACLVLKCSIADEPDPLKNSFLVPITKGDCGSWKKIYPRFQKVMACYGAIIIELEAQKNSRLQKYVLSLIEKYEKKDGNLKCGAIVANKVGNLEVLINGNKRKIFVLGPKSALPCSDDVNLEDLQKLDLIWVGDPSTPDMRIHPTDTDREEAWIKSLIDYCGRNVGSMCLLLGHLHLNMNISEIALQGIKLPTAHIVGQMSTGKSELASNIQEMYPRRFVEGNYIKESDRKMSVPLLSQESAKMRPPNIQG